MKNVLKIGKKVYSTVLDNSKKVVAVSALIGSSAFAAGSTATDTLLGKTVAYATTDLYGTVGVGLLIGLFVVGGAIEANKTKDLKPVWYALGLSILVAGAFVFGPDLFGYIKTTVGF
jgi:hypothetical protein